MVSVTAHIVQLDRLVQQSAQIRRAQLPLSEINLKINNILIVHPDEMVRLLSEIFDWIADLDRAQRVRVNHEQNGLKLNVKVVLIHAPGCGDRLARNRDRINQLQAELLVYLIEQHLLLFRAKPNMGFKKKHSRLV